MRRGTQPGPASVPRARLTDAMGSQNTTARPGPRRSGPAKDLAPAAGLVAAVHRGVTRALFRIEPGSWETKVAGFDKNGREIKRAAFRFKAIASGPLFDQVIGPHGHQVPPRAQGAQNSIHYWPHHPYKS
jgi:hypothetical protein